MKWFWFQSNHTLDKRWGFSQMFLRDTSSFMWHSKLTSNSNYDVNKRKIHDVSSAACSWMPSPNVALEWVNCVCLIFGAMHQRLVDCAAVWRCNRLLSLIKHCQIMFNIMRPRQKGRHFADYISKCIVLNENIWISIEFSYRGSNLR